MLSGLHQDALKNLGERLAFREKPSFQKIFFFFFLKKRLLF